MSGITGWLNPYRWAIYVALVVALVVALLAGYNYWANQKEWVGEQRATAAYNIAIKKQKDDAVIRLAEETAKVTAQETALREFKDKQEIIDAETQKTVAGLGARLRTLAGTIGRLRDPNADTSGCRCSGGSTPGSIAPSTIPGTDDSADAGGLLSAELTELLFSQAAKADLINRAYASCKADGQAIRKLSN